MAAAIVDHGNWTANINNGRWAAQPPAVAAGPLFTCTMNPGLPLPGPDVVNYGPPPFDVVGRQYGHLVAAFADFPLTVTP